MYKHAKTLFLTTETPLHAGSGDDLGVVDLPIQRERHTQYPKIESSSLKGALREAFESCFDRDKPMPVIEALFGPEEAGAMGAIALTDARLLLFPVKSVKGVFAWITCPRAIERLKSDLRLANITTLPDTPKPNTVPENCKLLIQSPQSSKPNIVLEEFTFSVESNTACTEFAAWLANQIHQDDNYWKNKMKTDIAVLQDDDFADFVQLATEVITRVKIDNKTGTVADGALFTEEYLPSESVMYSLVFASEDFALPETDEKGPKKEKMFKDAGKTMDEFSGILTGAQKVNHIFQLGGNATLGKGILRAKLI